MSPVLRAVRGVHVMRVMRVMPAMLAGALAAVSMAGRADSLELSGFGTLSAYHGDSDDAGVRPLSRVSAYSRGGAWRTDGDTVLGVQARLSLPQDWEAVWQVQSRDDLQRRFRPSTEWLYVGRQFGPSWTVRLGRQPLPVMHDSENSAVGFARPTVRPMSAVYVLNPVSPIDGVAANWRGTLGGEDFSLDLGGGGFSSRLNNGQVKGRSSSVAALTWSRSHWSVRAMLSSSAFDLVGVDPLAALAVYTAPGSPCVNCASVLPGLLRTQDIRTDLAALGGSWENGPWQLKAEYLRRRSNALSVATADGWYALLSYRHQTLTPFVGIGATRYLDKPPGLQAAPGASAAARAALGLVDTALSSPFDRRVVQAGLRWDLAEQIALKVQLDRWTATRDTVTPRNNEIVLLPGTSGWNGRVQLTTVSLDVVF